MHKLITFLLLGLFIVSGSFALNAKRNPHIRLTIKKPTRAIAHHHLFRFRAPPAPNTSRNIPLPRPEQNAFGNPTHSAKQTLDTTSRNPENTAPNVTPITIELKALETTTQNIPMRHNRQETPRVYGFSDYKLKVERGGVQTKYLFGTPTIEVKLHPYDRITLTCIGIFAVSSQTIEIAPTTTKIIAQPNGELSQE